MCDLSKKYVKGTLWAMCMCLLALSGYDVAAQNASPGKRVLVFSKTQGFRHASIPTGKAAIMQMGKENGFAVDTTENSALFTDQNLKKYNAVVFLSTTGDVLNDEQQVAFERYIQAGGGYVGIHAATDTEYEWPWYNKLSGAYFASHPGNPNVQTGEAFAVNRDHPSMKDFPDRWKVKDEFYDFKNFNKDVKVLVKIDEKTYKEGKMGDDHPMAWYHEFDGGKAFYTNFGHADETFSDPVFKKHLMGGLQYVMAGKLDYTKSRPEENRFTKTVLVDKLDEPTELVVLDNGKVIFTERKGAVKMYNPKTNSTQTINNIPVHFEREYGLMGINIDPNFKDNSWVYLYYSAVKPDTNNRLVRVKWDDVNNKLRMDTEQLILNVAEHRIGGQNDCCHTGGSIAWDREGNLYLSTGDNTNPFFSNGFAPIDQRPGREKYSALQSSSNTNDLRGKILRIKPRADGGYDIPAGNLFPQGTKGARPEIYVMGNRNPYRISVDQRTGFLYWGEVGPDAGEDNPKRGPRGHDEINQARKAGYFGWPLFVGDNKPYRDFNFADSTSGKAFDPAKPINPSKLITGLRELPPAQKAFIYYPYAESPDFGPIVGKGGRNAMAGPVYYYDDYADSKVKFPRYYDGKLFAYEWMRNWINPVTMTKEGDFVMMEKFMPTASFSHPMDMQFAKDGSLYMLEYGSNWFAQNDDARLSRITYNAGNRPPVAEAKVDKAVGAAPLAVTFSSKGSKDFDGDAIKYEWTFGKGLPKSTQANPKFTYSKPGEYTATLKVTDAAGNSGTTNLIIKVGNEVPKVDIAIKGNKSFYWADKPVEYQVKVTDKEDGSLDKGTIPTEDVMFNVNFMEGFDKAVLAQGHQTGTGFSTGRRLIELSDCKACHSLDQRSVGPAYMEVAKKYQRDRNALKRLSEKVIKGGGGVWGEQAMSAHPQLKQDEAEDMVRYILSLANDKKAESQMALQGNFVPKAQAKNGSYIFTATYTDKGNGQIGPMTGMSSIALRPARVQASLYEGSKDVFKFKLPEEGGEIVVGLKDGSYISYDDIDLTGIQNLKVFAISTSAQTVGGTLEVRLDSPTGPSIGQTAIATDFGGETNIPLSVPADNRRRNLFFVFKNPNAKDKPLFSINWIEFMNGSM
ncbi:ThuA domain-containing protein [Telluribacter sp. SYSU D00476]|uniref:ThuA domain-containing protein n=1 Tax=Telluribacter sp. SYSU D00476 TaxID=2811430 RepID=UPI0038F747EF